MNDELKTELVKHYADYLDGKVKMIDAQESKERAQAILNAKTKYDCQNILDKTHTSLIMNINLITKIIVQTINK